MWNRALNAIVLLAGEWSELYTVKPLKGEIYIGGLVKIERETWKPIIVKLSRELEVEWAKILDAKGHISIIDLEEVEGKIVMVGVKFIACIDRESGKIEWFRSSLESLWGVSNYEDRLVAYGTSTLIEFTPKGDVLRDVHIELKCRDNARRKVMLFKHMVRKEVNLVAGMCENIVDKGSGQDGVIVELDEKLKPVGGVAIGDSGNDWIFDIEEYNGRIHAAGWTESYYNTILPQITEIKGLEEAESRILIGGRWGKTYRLHKLGGKLIAVGINEGIVGKGWNITISELNHKAKTISTYILGGSRSERFGHHSRVIGGTIVIPGLTSTWTKRGNSGIVVFWPSNIHIEDLKFLKWEIKDWEPLKITRSHQRIEEVMPTIRILTSEVKVSKSKHTIMEKAKTKDIDVSIVRTKPF